MATVQPSTSKAALVVGWILTIVPAAMLIMSAVMKIQRPPEVLEGMTKVGWDENKMLILAALELSCTVLFLIPQTAVLGAILITGYLGGVVATHLRVDDPLWHILVGAGLGVAIWLGLYLREPRLRNLAPLR